MVPADDRPAGGDEDLVSNFRNRIHDSRCITDWFFLFGLLFMGGSLFFSRLDLMIIGLICN